MRLEEYDEKTQSQIRDAMKTDTLAQFEDVKTSYVADHEKQFGQDIKLKGLLTEDGKRTFLIQVRSYM